MTQQEAQAAKARAEHGPEVIPPDEDLAAALSRFLRDIRADVPDLVEALEKVYAAVGAYFDPGNSPVHYDCEEELKKLVADYYGREGGA